MNIAKLPLLKLGATAAGISVLILSARAILGHLRRKTEQDFEASLIEDFATVLAGELCKSREELSPVLLKSIREGNWSRLPSVRQLQYVMERTDERFVLKRTVYTLVGEADPLSLGSAMRVCPWSYLPESIRIRFAQADENEVQYDVFDRSKIEEP